jgi:hypothetical protein
VTAADFEQIGELAVGEEAAALAVHERADGALVEHLVAAPLRIVEEIGLPIIEAGGHRSLHVEDHLDGILSQLRSSRERSVHRHLRVGICWHNGFYALGGLPRHRALDIAMPTGKLKFTHYQELDFELESRRLHVRDGPSRRHAEERDLPRRWPALRSIAAAR